MTERPDEQDGAENNGDAPDEDSVWRSIVDNYGDRVVLEDPPQTPAPIRSSPAVYEVEEPDEPAGDEEHFLPPVSPPAEHATGPRLGAWLGVLGVPVLLLAFLLTSWSPPSPIGLILMCWFVGGFVYLVATMRKDPPDDWYDDGAVI